MVKLPTFKQLKEISAFYNLNLSDTDVESFIGLMGGALSSYHRLDELVEPGPTVKYPARAAAT